MMPSRKTASCPSFACDAAGFACSSSISATSSSGSTNENVIDLVAEKLYMLMVCYVASMRRDGWFSLHCWQGKKKLFEAGPISLIPSNSLKYI